MTRYLRFTIYAPLSSWGEIAVGESRGSWDRPSRSAILGLLGAALGVTREDAEGQAALSSGYGVAVRLDARGSALEDYHTVQTASASQVKKRKPATRAELLDDGDLETILSRRAYRQDAISTVAVWMRPGARWNLEALSSALRRPAFILYAGRRANALGVPLAPDVVEADTLRECLRTRTLSRFGAAGIRLRKRFEMAAAPEVSYDIDDGIASGFDELRRELRRDASPDRLRWQFSERVVATAIGDPAPVSGEAP